MPASCYVNNTLMFTGYLSRNLLTLFLEVVCASELVLSNPKLFTQPSS